MKLVFLLSLCVRYDHNDIAFCISTGHLCLQQPLYQHSFLWPDFSWRIMHVLTRHSPLSGSTWTKKYIFTSVSVKQISWGLRFLWRSHLWGLNLLHYHPSASHNLIIWYLFSWLRRFLGIILDCMEPKIAACYTILLCMSVHFYSLFNTSVQQCCFYSSFILIGLLHYCFQKCILQGNTVIIYTLSLSFF